MMLAFWPAALGRHLGLGDAEAVDALADDLDRLLELVVGDLPRRRRPRSASGSPGCRPGGRARASACGDWPGQNVQTPRRGRRGRGSPACGRGGARPESVLPPWCLLCVLPGRRRPGGNPRARRVRDLPCGLRGRRCTVRVRRTGAAPRPRDGAVPEQYGGPAAWSEPGATPQACRPRTSDGRTVRRGSRVAARTAVDAARAPGRSPPSRNGRGRRGRSRAPPRRPRARDRPEQAGRGHDPLARRELAAAARWSASGGRAPGG